MNDIEKSTQLANSYRGSRTGLPSSLLLLVATSTLTSTAVFILSLVWLAGYSFVIIPVSWFLTVLHHVSLIITIIVSNRKARLKQADTSDKERGRQAPATSFPPSHCSFVAPSTSSTSPASFMPAATTGISVAMDVKPAATSEHEPMSGSKQILGNGDRAEPATARLSGNQEPRAISPLPIDNRSSHSIDITGTSHDDAYRPSCPPSSSLTPPADATDPGSPTSSDSSSNSISTAVVHPANIVITCLLATLWSAASWLPIGTAFIFDPQWPGSRAFPALQGALGYLEAVIMWVVFAICLYWRLQALAREKSAIRGHE